MKTIGDSMPCRVPGGDGGAPATTANNVGAAAIVGALAGIPAGPVGVVAGAIVGGLSTSLGAVGSANDLPLWQIKGDACKGDPMCG